MKEIITNKYNLKAEDITEVVKRVKVLLINSNNEILLSNSFNEYHFPGGHAEENEELTDVVKREILEETGIELDSSNYEPFACSIGYWKDWPSEGKNRKTEVYYYEVLSDLKPNLDKVKRTTHEIEGNFTIKYVPFNKIEEVLIDNAKEYGDEHGIAKEMLELIKIYKSKDKTKSIN